MDILKSILIAFILVLSNNYSAQGAFYTDRYKKLFLIDDLSSQYDLKKYNLNTKELYGINKQIELYNFIEQDYFIVLFSVFQNSVDDFWIKVDYDLIKDKIITDRIQMNKVFYQMNNGDNKISKTMEYAIVKKIGQEYYIPAYCFTEFFNIREYDFPFVVRNGTINIKEKPVTIPEMYDYYSKNFTKYNFSLDVRQIYGSFRDDIPSRLYLSKTYPVKNEKAYQFWTFDWWDTIDGANIKRGIDRFVYISKKGIVGGSFDFYFNFYEGIKRDKLWDNIINERVMLAEELK